MPLPRLNKVRLLAEPVAMYTWRCSWVKLCSFVTDRRLESEYDFPTRQFIPFSTRQRVANSS